MAKTELFVRQQKGGMFSVVNESLTTGNIFFVDSGAGAQGGNTPGYGQNPDKPFLTLAYAVTQCTANNGDRIYVMPGHAEAVIAAGTITVAIAGIKIIGLGEGRNRPTFTWTTAAAATMLVDAANVTIENMVFDLTGVAAVGVGLVVGGVTPSPNFTLRDMEIIQTGAVHQAVIAMCLEDCDRALVENNVIRATDVGATTGINILATDDLVIKGNYIYGDFDNAPIWSDQVVPNITVKDNTLTNLQVGDFALEFQAASTGVISGNRLITDTLATSLDAGSCYCFSNLFYDLNVVDADATPVPTAVVTDGINLATIGNSVEVVEDVTERCISTGAAVMVNDDTLFTITAPILITGLVSECVTLNDATASTLQYEVNPTVGVAVTISGASASLGDAAAGATVSLIGTTLATAALLNASGGNLGATTPIVAMAGDIDIAVAVGSTTGTWRHHIRYKPLVTGALVTV